MLLTSFISGHEVKVDWCMYAHPKSMTARLFSIPPFMTFLLIEFQLAFLLCTHKADFPQILLTILLKSVLAQHFSTSLLLREPASQAYKKADEVA